MSTTQSLYPKAKDCGCVKFVGGRKKRRTRRKHKKRKTHKRRRTRRHHKKRKTRRTRKGGEGMQIVGGGYKENMIMARLVGGNRPIFAVSDYPPGFKKFTNRDKRRWKNVMKTQHKKKHRKK